MNIDVKKSPGTISGIAARVKRQLPDDAYG